MSSQADYQPATVPTFPQGTWSAPCRVPIAVAQVMIAPVAILPRNTTVGEALRIMRLLGCDLLIIDPLRRSEQFGIVTRRDLRAKAPATGGAAELAPVSELLAASALLVAPEMWIEDCATLLLAARVRRAVVVKGGRPVGIICDTDIYQAIESRSR
jgi:signal-transduction protein with cAMP-binding, CBS, and nucleotidyltransferase domain